MDIHTFIGNYREAFGQQAELPIVFWYSDQPEDVYKRQRSTAVCKFLGDISYPVYITHYPLVYTYTAWVCNNNATLAEGIPYMILTFAGAFILAYACLKLYDEPIRKWLTDRFLKGKKVVKS